MIKLNLKYKTSLYNEFLPIFLYEKKYLKQIENKNPEDFVIALKRGENNISRYETKISTDSSIIEESKRYAEKLVKTLIWIYGGYDLYIHAPKDIFDYIQITYSEGGKRYFDTKFIIEDVFDKKLKINYCKSIDEVPNKIIQNLQISTNLDGYRIGFDLGGSDKKISAMIDGKVLFAESIIWNPIEEKNIEYHKKEILEILNIAKEKLGGRVDAIGGSAPGIIIDNKIKVSSIVRNVENREDAKNLFLDVIEKHFPSVPFRIANDGDVSALAGASILKQNRVLGIAMGTSQACGYSNLEGGINNCLNELAFIPIDLSKNAPLEEWSGDFGCGANFFSQQAVIRLAEETELDLSNEDTFAKKLKKVQKLLDEKNKSAQEIFRTIGYNFGYTVPWYAKFYDLKVIMLMGRVMKGEGGKIIKESAEKVLHEEFFDLKVELVLPNDNDALHGQAIAAGSLVEIKK